MYSGYIVTFSDGTQAPDCEKSFKSLKLKPSELDISSKIWTIDLFIRGVVAL